MEEFEYLKSEYNRKFTILNSISYDTDLFLAQKEELDKGREHWLTFCTLSDIKYWIDEITEAIDMEFLGQELPDYVEMDRLLVNQLI